MSSLVPHTTHQWVSIRPAEVVLNGLIIQTSPLVFFIVAWGTIKHHTAISFYKAIKNSHTQALTKNFLYVWNSGTYCWCSSAPLGSWWKPGELPACGSAAQLPPSSDADQSDGNRNREICPNWVHISPGLTGKQQRNIKSGENTFFIAYKIS